MTDLRRYLVAQVERRLRERDAENRTLLRGQSAESGYDVGVRAALQALAEVFTREETKADLFDVLSLEASRVFHSGPHPRSRTYRAEPTDWAIEDTQAKSVLALVQENIARAKKAQTQPAVVFDLDGTLFDVSHRTLGILREWTTSQADTRRYPRALLRRVESIALCHMGYSLSHAFENAGLDLRDNATGDALPRDGAGTSRKRSARQVLTGRPSVGTGSLVRCRCFRGHTRDDAGTFSPTVRPGPSRRRIREADAESGPQERGSPSRVGGVLQSSQRTDCRTR